MSASKWEFLLRLELDSNNADHQSAYWLMKVCFAVRACTRSSDSQILTSQTPQRGPGLLPPSSRSLLSPLQFLSKPPCVNSICPSSSPALFMHPPPSPQQPPIKHTTNNSPSQNEAINVYNAQLRNRSALRREHRNAEAPWTANQFTEDTFNAAIATIEAQASPRTRVLYARGRNGNGPNWVIRWILYHVCRYRDGRNRKAQSRNFHDDDELDGGSGGAGAGAGAGAAGECSDLSQRQREYVWSDD